MSSKWLRSSCRINWIYTFWLAIVNLIVANQSYSVFLWGSYLQESLPYYHDVGCEPLLHFSSAIQFPFLHNVDMKFDSLPPPRPIFLSYYWRKPPMCKPKHQIMSIQTFVLINQLPKLSPHLIDHQQSSQHQK